VKPRKLVWTEGLFITQHHFQQLDRYHEQLLESRLRGLVPYDWGLIEYEVDERALAAGQFRVTRLTGILPDGTLVSFGEQRGDVIPPRVIDQAFTPQMRSLDVYLAVPHEGEAIPNVDLDGKAGALQRYVREQGTAYDFNLGTNEATLQAARPNFRILFGDERTESFHAIRIAQLVRNASGAIVVRENFVPPISRLSASPFLLAGFRKLLTVMTAKQRSLAESRRQRTAAAVEFQASDAAKFWLLNALNLSIPQMAHLVDHGIDHPEVAYLALSQLIGQLCTFAVDGDPTAVPKFNYLELGDVFDPMFQRAHKLLEAVIAERYIEIPLTKRDDGMHLGKITDANYLRFEFYLAASGLPEVQIRDRLPQLSKMASWNQIGSILNSAVSGLKLALEYTPPGALPIKPGIVFFKVTKTPEFWNDIAGTGTLAVYQPMDPNAMKLALYAVDPANL
jgi:type VI secretion system protein ImpJ